MEKQVTDPNYEDEGREIETQLTLTHIVDPGGLSLSVYQGLTINETLLLAEISCGDRDPDTQFGGEYCGNQYAEISQIYRNSVSIWKNRIEIDLTILATGYDSSP